MRKETTTDHFACCPNCGFGFVDSWEFPDEYEGECPECNKPFKSYREHRVRYHTMALTAVPPEPDGKIWRAAEPQLYDELERLWLAGSPLGPPFTMIKGFESFTNPGGVHCPPHQVTYAHWIYITSDAYGHAARIIAKHRGM